ncbi:MAG: hypothetical protein COW87_03010, partial [Candidatus Levybacteria bacterium CG22_combo_CG10-13_8_21_14_all_35_11]
MAESKIKDQKSKIKKAEVKTVKSKVEKKTVEKPVVKSVQKAKGLKVEVLDLKGKVIESMNLPKEIFGAKIN